MLLRVVGVVVFLLTQLVFSTAMIVSRLMLMRRGGVMVRGRLKLAKVRRNRDARVARGLRKLERMLRRRATKEN